MRYIVVFLLLLSANSGARSVGAADDEKAQALAAIKSLGGLVRETANGLAVDFHLRGRKLADADLKHVAALKNVTSLNLSRTQIKGPGLAHLKSLQELRHLHLERTDIGDDAMSHLASLRSLEYLNLYQTKITDKALAQLVECKSLQRLYVWNTAVSKAGAARLEKTRPNLTIVRGLDLSELAVTFPKEEQPQKPKAALKWVAVSSRAEAPPRSESGVNCQVWFENKSKQTVKLYWIAYGNGELKLYGTIAPGATRQQNTYSRNVWLVTNEKDEPLGYFVVKEDDSYALIPG